MTDTVCGSSDPKSLTPWERVLYAYIDVAREFRLIEDAARMHQDRMLTWAIGLVGGGVFASVHLLSVGVCQTIGPRALILAASPWAFGVLFAVLGRIAGAWYREVPNIFSVGEAYLIRLELVRGPDQESAERFLHRLSNDPSRAQYEKKAGCAKTITRWSYYLTLGMFLLGMISVFLRVVTC